MFDVEAIHGFAAGKYLIKWEGYSQLTEEPEANLPAWMVAFYKSQNKKVVKIPMPKIIGSKVIGSIKYHQLSWDPEKPATILPESSFDIETVDQPAAMEAKECNTKKDKDRRKNRHTCLYNFF